MNKLKLLMIVISMVLILVTVDIKGGVTLITLSDMIGSRIIFCYGNNRCEFIISDNQHQCLI